MSTQSCRIGLKTSNSNVSSSASRLMRRVRGNVQDFALPDDDFFAADEKAKRALEHVGHLFALVRVHRHQRAALEVGLREHLAFAGHDLLRDASR